LTERRIDKLETKTDTIEITLAKLSGLPGQISRLVLQNDKIFKLLEDTGKTLTDARLEVKGKRDIEDCEKMQDRLKRPSNGNAQSTTYIEIIKVLVAALIAMGGAVGGIRFFGG